MDSSPLISVITPCSRPNDLTLAIEIFKSQDYLNKEMIILIDRDKYDQVEHLREDGISIRQLHDGYSESIGSKRNWCCVLAKGDIIFMADSDDFYAPDFISRSYNHLITTGADVTGLSSAYFYQPHTKMWKYSYTGVQPYVLGSAMMFHKPVWSRNPFPDKNVGEDAKFLANAGHIIPHNYIDGFIAMIHGNNTASHTQTPYMKRVDIELAKSILGDFYGNYI